MLLSNLSNTVVTLINFTIKTDLQIDKQDIFEI